MKKSASIPGTVIMLVLAVSFIMSFTACSDNSVQRNYFIVTFDKNNTDPDSTEANPRTKFVYGDPDPWTVITLPQPPTRVGYMFTGWNESRDGDGAEFLNTTIVAADITVYAQWDSGTVSVSQPDSQIRAFQDLEEAFDYIEENGTGDYTVTVNSNQFLAQRIFSGVGVNVTLRSTDDAIITRIGPGDLLIVEDGASLTLDGNLVLNGASQNWRGVTIKETGIFTMEGGTISGFKGTDGGGVNNLGEFTMKGGTISGNSASGNGGGVNNLATFTMEGGTISGNTAAGLGGGVYVSVSTEFTMEGGTISGNTASNLGGGVYVATNGIFSLEGGTIQENNAANGGGVYNVHNFTMKSGTISGNTAENGGGGVYSEADFSMEGGAISGNKATDGGGVYIDPSGTLTMDAGTINGNQADKGGGVYNDSLSFSMEGETAVISGNKADDGGGVYNKYIFIMNAGAINGNEAVNDGGGVYNFWNFTLNDGIIGGNTAAGNGGGVYVGGDYGKFRKDKGIIYGNDGTVQSNGALSGDAVYVDWDTPEILNATVGNEETLDFWDIL